jgi:recombination protein RecA
MNFKDRSVVPKKKGQVSRAAALANAVNATLGPGTMRLGADPYFEITRVPTGSLTIDRITGGGFALGRHVELYGDENACKSFIAYRTMALSQERGNICALIDPEHSFEREWFIHLGGKPDELLTMHPQTAESAVQTMMILFQTGEIEICMVDSVAALLPREEREKNPIEEDRIASQARFMSRALRRLTAVNDKTLVLWTNQLRTKIGGYGDPTTTPGGRALKFYDTTRIELRKGELVKRERKVAKKGKLVETPMAVGNWVQCKSQKEKSTYPYRQGSFIFDTEKGEIDLASEIIQLGLEDGLVTRNGNRFSYTDLGDNVWSGTESIFKRALNENAELADELIQAIDDETISKSVSSAR